MGEARRAAAGLAAELGFDDELAGRVALAVTELGTNLARHAVGGHLLIGSSGNAHSPSIDVLSIDDGPGMADLSRCLVDGYSTGGTPGTGLGAVRRLSTTFSAHSAPGTGTVILSRMSRRGSSAGDASPFEVAGITLSAPGERVSGDAWHVVVDGQRARIIVADGLGHGPVAAEAADAAIAFFGNFSGPPSRWLDAAHGALRGTRGAAVAVAELDAAERAVTYAAAGNIAGRLVSGVEERTLLSQHGTLGVQVRKLADTVYPWPPHACLVMHSDGVNGRWTLADAASLLQCDAAVIAAWLLRGHERGRDDATVVVARTR